MLYIGLALANAALFIWIFWALYVFTMGIYRLKLNNQLKGLNYFFAIPFLILAVATDFIGNILATFIFLDLPREKLVTGRLQRYQHSGKTGWRVDLANRICHGMLDMFDPRGKHC